MSTVPFISVPDVNALSDEIIASMRRLLINWTPDDSDPGVYIADEIAQRIINYINDANKSLVQYDPETADRDGLAVIGRRVNIVQGDNESNSDFLQRYYDAWIALSPSTKEFIRLLLRRASRDSRLSNALRMAAGNAFDVGIVRDLDNNLGRVYIINDEFEGIEAADRALIETYLNQLEVKPFWIDYSVDNPTINAYTVNALLVYRGDSENIITNATASLRAAISRFARLGNSISVDQIRDVLRVTNVFDVIVTSPANNLVAANDSIVYVGEVGNITIRAE